MKKIMKGEAKKSWRDNLQSGYSIEFGSLDIDRGVLSGYPVTCRLKDGEPKTVEVWSCYGMELATIDSVPEPAKTYLQELYKEESVKYKRFPIEGKGPPKVEDRPRCPECAKPLRPNLVSNEYLGVRRWQGYDSYGHFCSLKCAEKFANFVLNSDLDLITSTVKSLRRYHNLVPHA